MTDLSLDSESTIAGISSPAILYYFKTFNAQAFQLTASLFADTGILYPPFERAIVGREAIAAYLEKEARGMKVLPHEGILQTADSGVSEIKVMGKVQTSLFNVNVSWLFKLDIPDSEAQGLKAQGLKTQSLNDAQAKILTVQIKLLAALEELLSLQK